MFLFNPSTGELKQANKLSNGFTEVSVEQYKDLQGLDAKDRIGALPDLDVNILNAHHVKVSDNSGKQTNVNSDGVDTNGGMVGKTVDGATTTSTWDAETGNIDTVGNITAGGGSFKVKPTIPDAKGNQSPAASMADIAEGTKGGIQHITSPDSSLVVNDADKSNTTVTVRVGSKVVTGILRAGDTIDVDVGGIFNYNLPAGNDKLRGGYKVIGGSTGIRIQKGSTDILEADPAVSSLDYFGTLDAAKNEGGIDKHKLSDDDNPDIYHGGFYVVSVPGVIQFKHGPETCDAGDWVIFEQVEGQTAGKWVSVPVGKYQSVHSVNGKVGTVVLDNKDIGLGNVKNVDQTVADNLKSGTIGLGVGVKTDKDLETSGTVKANVMVITGKLLFQKG